MKILVSGCSFSSGHGFTGREDPAIWPNLLAKKLSADLTNMAKTGNDNVGIYLQTKSQSLENWDLILIQWTSLERIVIGSIPEHSSMISEINPRRDLIDEQSYRTFHQVFTMLNGPFEHWNRLVVMINEMQAMPNIKFINGFFPWTAKSFSNNPDAWTEYLLPRDTNNYAIIESRTKKLIDQMQSIDLSKWINPFENWQSTRIDTVSDRDAHPGEQSHRFYANQILQKL